MNFAFELQTLLATQTPLLHVITYEEDRALQAVLGLRDGFEAYGVTTWDHADGFVTHRKGAAELPNKECNPESLLPYLVEKMPENHIVVLKDFHHVWRAKPGYITRKLRNMIPKLRSKNQFLLMLTPPLPADNGLPRELKHDSVTLEVPLPTQEELDRLFTAFTASLDRNTLPRPELRHKIIESALGLSTLQARLAFARSYAASSRFDERAIESITWAKQQIIRDMGALEFWPTQTAEGDVGGLDLLKNWLKLRELGFSAEAQKQGIPFPRGVALIGIPGTGKSLSAKMLSGLWKLPLLRLDVGALFSSGLGESEAAMRRAISLAETVSPCILWVDEMEKAFAGVNAGNINSGASTRLFGTFLTWMQEHQKPVFVIATANEIEGLPPELMGRFDQTFFLDLPNADERRAIWNIHLKNARVQFPERSFRLPELVNASQGLVGREIARVVVDAQFRAFADGNREMTQQDLIESTTKIVPLSRSHAERIENLRRWKTDGRAMPATSDEITAAPGRARNVIV